VGGVVGGARPSTEGNEMALATALALPLGATIVIPGIVVLVIIVAVILWILF
jgi:hypothetical protein